MIEEKTTEPKIKVRFLRPAFLRKMSIENLVIELPRVELVDTIPLATDPQYVAIPPSEEVVLRADGKFPVSQKAKKCGHKKTWKRVTVAIETIEKRECFKDFRTVFTIKGMELAIWIKVIRAEKGGLVGEITIHGATQYVKKITIEKK